MVRSNRKKERREQLKFQWELIVLGRKTMFPQTYVHPKALRRFFMKKLTVMLGDFDIIMIEMNIHTGTHVSHCLNNGIRSCITNLLMYKAVAK